MILFFCFYLCPENLVAKTGQFSSLHLVSAELRDFGRGRGIVNRVANGGVSCRIIYNICNIYNIYMITISALFYTEGDLSVVILWFFFLLFLLWFWHPPIFFYAFSVIVFCVFLGKGHVVSPPSVYSLHI